MAGNRKAAEAFIVKYIDKIAPGGDNKKLYEDMFKTMTNKEFDMFMNDLENEKINLSVNIPTGGKIKLDTERNLKIAKELGVDFFERLIYNDEYKTPEKYLVYKLPIRRAAQLLSKKVAIPDGDNHLDLSSGQVTGASKASKLTMPEIQILSGLGLKKSIVELMKYRGGDLDGNRAMNMLLYKQGRVSQEVLKQYSGGVVSTKTLKAYFEAAHLRNTL